MEGEHFDAVIIGAGMSGLAAGIRLALFDKKVIILERHNAIGGLNSFYSIDGRKYDVGLHAMTNYAPGVKGAPLNKLFRQLRINPNEFNLSPQKQSKIVFNGCKLHFSNDLNLIKSQIAQQFPNQIDGFCQLCLAVEQEFMALTPDQELSALSIIPNFISDPFLANILLLPLLYYGSPQENDITWNQFVILFKSIYLEGLARPYEGIRLILHVLKDKYNALGGLRKMKCGVRQIISSNNNVQYLILDNGTRISADHIISSIGLPETLNLCSERPKTDHPNNIGQLSFVETISIIKDQPKTLGWNDTIIFFNDSHDLQYQCPHNLVNTHSGVICIPNNYEYSNSQELPEGILRTTVLANYALWNKLSPDEYKSQKNDWFDQIHKKALQFLPELPPHYLESITLAKDMFTPKTIHKYTGRLNGAIYGATRKTPSGNTHLNNLYICGTDQGLLGITGSLISGISMANKHILIKNNPR